MSDVPMINGRCAPGFEPVRDAIADNFRAHGEIGAAVAVIHRGQPVVDLWAGWMDRARTREWERDTLVAVFSVGKAMAALCVLELAESGALDLDGSVARVWPEFAAEHKGDISVRTLLSHRAGLPAIRRPLADDDVYDWDVMASALAAEAPWWAPGTTHGYHVNTFGFLTGELVRRVTGERIGAFFRREVAEPVGADFHFGLGPEHDSRTAEYCFPRDRQSGGESEGEFRSGDADRQFMLMRAYLNPPAVSGIGAVNTRAWRAAEIPSANGHATARAVAQIYAALIEHRLLRPATLDAAIAEASAGTDFVLGRPSRFGLGFQLTQPERRLGPNARSFGHFGAGGSLGFADPDAALAFGYVMNDAGPRWQNPRNRALIDAVYSCLV
jgi:CubicO group peptidase (beta-lactamase class C family)